LFQTTTEESTMTQATTLTAMMIVLATVATSCGKEEKSSMGGQSGTTSPGGENTNQGSDQGASAMTLAVTAAEMPACTPENNNQLVYVKDSAKFMTCSGGAWADIAIKGEKGDAGAKGDPGAKGDKGDQGDAGPGMEISHIYQCTGGTDIGLSDYRYGDLAQITRYTNGSYLFSCAAFKFPVDASYADSSSYTMLWPADSNGVLNGKITCIPYYVTSEFNIAAKTVTYINQEDQTLTETVACPEVFPGN
jgi:hypothetical protein